MNTTTRTNDFLHQLWRIYSQLKDAESNPEQRLELLERSREELGKSLNCLYRQFGLIPEGVRDKD
jgi:hypothetical protein